MVLFFFARLCSFPRWLHIVCLCVTCGQLPACLPLFLSRALPQIPSQIPSYAELKERTKSNFISSSSTTIIFLPEFSARKTICPWPARANSHKPRRHTTTSSTHTRTHRDNVFKVNLANVNKTNCQVSSLMLGIAEKGGALDEESISSEPACFQVAASHRKDDHRLLRCDARNTGTLAGSNGGGG